MSQKQIKKLAIAHGMILNEFTLSEETLSRIQAAAPDTEIVIIKNSEDWDSKKNDVAEDIEVIFGLRPATWFHEMPNLKWGQQIGAGANWLLDMPEVAESDFILTNASGVHAIPIAEHILALMFALGRGLHLNIRSQTQKEWKRGGRVSELDGATLGVIGVGAIGEKTAEKAGALNMKVIGVRRNPDRQSPFVDQMVGPDQLLEILPQCDWVAITAAMTEETTGMIGEAELKAMKESAYILNIARGSVIQEIFLIKALQEKWIAGAGLDVFETEPLPDSSPLWDMKNVIITPHYSGATPYYLDRLLDIFLENLKRYQAGEPMINIVDKKLGY